MAVLLGAVKVKLSISTYGGEASYLVSKSLGLDHSYFLCNSLVGVKVEGQPVIIFLNDHPGGLLDGLCTNATLHTKYAISHGIRHCIYVCCETIEL